MTWAAAADVNRFTEAIDWFARRTPITEAEFLRNVEVAHREGFWISGVTRAEVIRSVFDDMKRALEEGVPFSEWKKTVGPKLEREWLGSGLSARERAFRTELVLRNWSQGAYNRARWAQINEPAVKRFRPYALFDGVKDSRQSEICKACNDTCLPIDHPWWDTHRPPLHHACRSGIRSLTAARAQARGVTKSPPEVEADTGWGRGDEYAGPDRRKLQVAKPPPKPKAVPKPPKAELEKPPIGGSDVKRPLLRERAGELATALERGNHADARRIVRDAVRETFPDAVSKDLAHPRGDVYEVLSQQAGGGFHHWDGGISLGHETIPAAARFLRGMEAGAYDGLSSEQVGRALTPPSASEAVAARGRVGGIEEIEARRRSARDLDHLRTVVHEEMHGFSRIAGHTYRGAAAVVEEVATELSARAVLERALGAPIRGSYGEYIGEVEAIVARAANVSFNEARRRIVNAHAAQNTIDGGLHPTGEAYLEHFVDGLDLTAKGKAATLSELRRLRAVHLPETFQ